MVQMARCFGIRLAVRHRGARRQASPRAASCASTADGQVHCRLEGPPRHAAPHHCHERAADLRGLHALRGRTHRADLQGAFRSVSVQGSAAGSGSHVRSSLPRCPRYRRPPLSGQPLRGFRGAGARAGAACCGAGSRLAFVGAAGLRRPSSPRTIALAASLQADLRRPPAQRG